MLSSKTVFVLGAGASAEVGLPIGDALKLTIAEKLNYRYDRRVISSESGDHKIYNFLHRTFREDFNKRIKACTEISHGIEFSTSIDNFIDTHKHDQYITECGKVSIAASILEAEKGSALYVDPSNAYNKLNLDAIRNTWFMRFYYWIAQGVGKADLGNIFDNVTVISFNYDRCIQHFLVHAIAQNYLIPLEEAKAIVRKLRIYFPYGSVGAYLSEHENNLPFGSDDFPRHEKIISGLKTYTEQVEDSAALTDMRNAIAQANPIIYLGNAYHDSNINLLCGGQHVGNVSKAIYGTRMGILSDDDLRVVMAKLEKVQSRPGLASFRFAETCHNLFQEYARSMRGS